MIRGDFHLHTTLCDGDNTPAEMAEAAVAAGLTHLGFSAHSPLPFYEDYCLADENGYFAEIERLKTLYRDHLTILCGIEKDLFSPMDTSRCDYIIGSVHYLKVGEEYLILDLDEDTLRRGVDRLCGGDWYCLAERYFAEVAALHTLSPSVIGHFDLITKYNRDGHLFDETHPRYQAAAKAAIDALLPHNIPFEINTGAMSRGYADRPYPSSSFLCYIAEKGGRVILSSDAHAAQNLCYKFDEARALAAQYGCTLVESPLG